jgi:hypothetical protein
MRDESSMDAKKFESRSNRRVTRNPSRLVGGLRAMRRLDARGAFERA